MPMSQVIAPGVSYSPDQPGGYTQADLDFLARGPAPVMPIAPTTGEVATIDNQMSYAPPGVTEPTRWTPGQTPFPGIGNIDFLKGLDFSNLPDFSNIDIDAILKDYQDRQDAGEPEPFESFFTEPLKHQSCLRPVSRTFIKNQFIKNQFIKNQFIKIPNFPIQQPMNFTGLPNIPASSCIQPRVEDIISPIRTGSTRRLPQPGLFNLR
jgi:hypothetical protein